jgi:hypothetical protein
MSHPYPDYAARQYPPGEKPDRRRITKCSDQNAWYAGMVDEVITVHYFCTFGCWDTQGRWIDFYDLSAPLNEPVIKKSKNWFKNLFK